MKKIVVHSKETINKERPIPVASVEPMMQVKKPVDTSSLLQSTNPHTECAMNPHLPMASNSTTGNANVHIMAQKHAQPHRHMYVKPAIKANQLNGQIDRYAAKWIEHGYDFAHPSITTQENFPVFGRIVADNDEKLTESSVLLEFSRSMGSGARIPLDLSHCPSFSIFPGQLTCLEGRNLDGSKFIVSAQKQAGFQVSPSVPVAVDKFGTEPISLMVAAGPYSLDNGQLDFSPIDRLLMLGLERKPDVLLLIGPFIDANNSAVVNGKISDMPENLIRNVLLSKLQILMQKSPHTKIVLSPSLQEFSHDFTFPQCALQASLLGDLHKNLICLPNPGLFWVNELLVGVSSADALLQLGLSEVCRNSPANDRIARLCGHIYDQGSFYPIIPGHEGLNIDYQRLEALEFPAKPHLMLMPSLLKQFAKPLPSRDAVFVNPGQFCRKQALGSCALVTIHPRQSPAELNDTIDIISRCRVDLVQF